MLVLSRKSGERILIGDDIVIQAVRIGPNSVRLGISAPRDIPIVREELEELTAGAASEGGTDAGVTECAGDPHEADSNAVDGLPESHEADE